MAHAAEMIGASSNCLSIDVAALARIPNIDLRANSFTASREGVNLNLGAAFGKHSRKLSPRESRPAENAANLDPRETFTVDRMLFSSGRGPAGQIVLSPDCANP